jgi:flagellar hook-associated protein 1 FlgK
VTQNNVANASTPGFAKQSLQLVAMQMDLFAGSSGGVTTGQLASARNEFSEQSVRRQSTALGREKQLAASLTSLQTAFDISGRSGIPAALNAFFQSVSAWGQSPDSQPARQTVISRAEDVAQTFQSTATTLSNLTHDNEVELAGTVDQVNQLVGQVQSCNRLIQESGSASRDAGVDAQVHSSLEQLSALIEFSAVREDDGTTTILLNGNTPLLTGIRTYPLHASLSVADGAETKPATAHLIAADGADITKATTGGRLGALIEMRNNVLASLIGDSNQPGDLNRLAQQFADRVNTLLTAGTLSDGPPPIYGAPLFSYDATSDTNVASTLAVHAAATPDQLAATDPGPPYISNGVALALSRMATPTNDTDRIDGLSYAEFFGNMASQVGSQLQDAQNRQQVQQTLVAQAQNQRQELSGVSLDEEAMILVEFQRAYQANSRFLTVLDQLTQEAVDILR